MLSSPSSLYAFMGVSSHNWHWQLSTATAFALLFFASVSVSATTAFSSTRRLASGVERGGGKEEMMIESRRRLGGPGSAPPTCRSKCGRCTPCKPVHVPIQWGRSMPLEYYPEAWRCKCGNKLFMP